MYGKGEGPWLEIVSGLAQNCGDVHAVETSTGDTRRRAKRVFDCGEVIDSFQAVKVSRVGPFIAAPPERESLFGSGRPREASWRLRINSGTVPKPCNFVSTRNNPSKGHVDRPFDRALRSGRPRDGLA